MDKTDKERLTLLAFFHFVLDMQIFRKNSENGKIQV